MQVQATTPTPQKTAAMYIRVSTLEQGEHGYGLDAQLADCERLAVEMGAKVVATYEDRHSGASWALPGLNAMLDAAGRGEFETLIVYDPDRLSRRMAKYVVLEQELKRAGVGLRYVTIRGGDSPEDRALQQMKAVFAELDYERIILRLMRAKRIKAEKGLIVGTGVAPYGYRSIRGERGRAIGLAIDPTTAPIVQRIFRDIQRMSLRALCERLDAEGIPTYFKARGAVGWHPATLAGILDNPVYLGTAPYGRRNGAKQWQSPDAWIYSPAPVIIERDLWDAAHEALSRRKMLRQRKARTPESEAAYPLRGLLMCAHCGGALQVAINTGYRYYRCLRNKTDHARRNGQTRCPLPSVPAEPLERLAWAEVVGTLLDTNRLREGMMTARAEHEAASSRQRGRVDTLDAEIARLRGRLDRIIEEQLDAAGGSESARLLREKASQIEAALSRLQIERTQLAAEPVTGLSDRDAEDLATFAAEVRTGAEHATPLERRRVFQLLKLTGAVRLDDTHGIKLAKRNRFAVDWTAIIQLRRSDREFVNIQTIWVGPATAPATPPQQQAVAVE